MSVIDTNTRALYNIIRREKRADFTLKFPHDSFTKMGEREGFLFVISKVVTLMAASVCTPAITNKQHQNYHFDILICGVLPCELHPAMRTFI